MPKQKTGSFLRFISLLLPVICLLHDLSNSPTLINCSSRFPTLGGIMVSVLVSGSSAPGLSPGQGHCVVFLGEILYSHIASLCPGV